MNVYWLEQIATDVPANNDWLGANETARLSGLRFAKRRDDWRLGRWTAKQAMALHLSVPALPQVLARIEIRAAPSGAPLVFVANKPEDVTISLSHRDGTAACAVAPSGAEIGCDLELVEARSEAFVADYFTREEQSLVTRASAPDRNRLLTLLWSAKESALKALGEGLRLDTRDVIVDPCAGSCDINGWSPLRVRYAGGKLFQGWYRLEGDLMRTVVCSPQADSPIFLSAAPHPVAPAFQCTTPIRVLAQDLHGTTE